MNKVIAPYQLLPPSEVKKDQKSVLLAVVVLLGGVLPPDHLTVPLPASQVIERPAVPSFVSCNTKPYNLPLGGAVSVKSQLSFNVAVTNVPSATSIVADDPVLPKALTFSA